VHAARLKANAQDFHTKKAWTSVHNTIEGSPVSFARFESIVAEMDKIVKATYEESGCSDTDRVDAEKDMLIMGEIPQVLMPVIGRLLSQTIRKFQEDVDPAQLYFTDVRWLGLTDDYATTEYQKKHAVDVVRKLPLRSDARLRRCTRCCAYMEDTVPPRPFQPWMVQLLRTCVCGNQWILVNGQ
jgi:mediator of RNA polymerase II transcription subunit 16